MKSKFIRKAIIAIMSDILRVLILEDSPDDTELIVKKLRQAGYTLSWDRVETESDYLAHLDPALDVILADYKLPQFDGLRALHLLQERKLDIPFIIVSGVIGEERAVAAMKQGAADYILKDRLERLGTAVTQSLERKRLLDEKRRMEQHLQKRERFFRALIEHSSDGIVLVNEKGETVYESPGIGRILGYSIAEDTGENIFELAHPADSPDTWALYNQLREHPGTSLSGEFRVRHKHGDWRWIQVAGTNLLHEPSVQAIVANCRDITERKQAEEAMSRLAAIVESADEAIIAKTLDGIITSWNPAAERLYGYTAEEAIGHNISLIVPPNRPDEVPQILTKLKRGEQVKRLETIRQRKDGQQIHVFVTLSPIKDPAGKITGASAIAHDITELKRAEEKLKYLINHDSLTNLFNRAYFEEEMTRLQQGRQYPISIIMADVDGLKRVNDTLGHPAGDTLLRRAAQVLKNSFRAEDVVARVGGDEFIALMPNTDNTTAEQIAVRIHKRLVAHNEASEVPLSMSLGIATIEKGEKLDDGLKQADERMYREKFTRRLVTKKAQP
ncbi:MAG: PAS domain S-box protein [Chloroflexi bacterium]|nr:PAS domain S-box protein [Chloroflexota bacterium]